MVTAKLKAIRQIIKADHVMLFTKKGTEDVQALGFGQGGLKDILLMAIELKKSYNNMVDMANNAAVESGELHALTELKKALEEVDNGRQ